MAPLRRRAPAQSACTAEGGLPVEQPAKQGKDGEKRGDVVTVYEHDSDEGVFVVDDGKTEDVVEEETFECDVCDDGSQRPLYVGGCSNDDDECDCELTVDEEDKDQDIDDLCEAYTAARDDMDDVIEAYRRLTAMPKDEVMPEESPEEQPPAAAETEEPQVQPNPDDREGGAEVAPPAEVPAAPPSDEMAADTKVHRRLAGKRAVSPAEVRPPKAPKVEPEGPLPIPQAKMPRLSEDVCSVLLASVVSDTVEDEKELRVLYVNSEDPEVLEGMESVMESLRVPAQHSYEGVPGGSTAGTALRAPAAAAPHLGASGSRLFEEQQVATLQELLARHLRAQGAPRAAAWLAGRGAAGLPAASQAGEVARERLAIGAAEEKERVKEYKQKQWKRIYQLAELIISLKAAGKSAAIETTEVSVLKAAILQLLPQAEQQKSISKRAEILKDKIQRVEKQLGAFTVDIYNCMFGRNENSLNLFQIGDLARVSAVASQHHAGMEIDSPNAHVDHTVSQPATAANCQVKHVPTLPELFDQVQWRLQLSWDYRGMLLHPFADLALRMHPPRPSTDQATHHVYTDASLYSKSPELAAFALAHVTQDSTGFACQGYVAARAATSHSFDNMAEQTHSTEVELLGAVWAAIFSLQLPFDEQVYIICDNMAAVDKALSRVRLVSELDKMAATVPRDVQCVRPISVVQEPGHQDYPWNEAVDSISRHFTKESTVPPDLPQVPRQALRYTVDAEWQFTRSAEPVQDIFGYSSKMILCYWLASSEVTDVSGSIGPTDSLDFNGFELQKISNQYSMKITNTFLPHEHPETFRAKCGTLHRLDYILLQGSIHACVKTCYVMTDLDLGGKSPDHWPVVVTIEAAKYYTTPEAGRKRLDRQKLADPIRRNKFRQALLEMPVPPWATDINQQVDDFNCKINQLTAELFAEDRFSPRKPYIKTGTMALIRLLRFNGKQAKRCDHTLLPQRFKQDGSVIASELEWAETLRRHFAQLEDGYECTASALQTEYNQLSLNHALGFPRSSSAIPSPTWLATRIRGVKAHRAPGHDLVQNAVPKAAPEAVLPHILAITAKTGLLVQEAVIHKAGLACGLHKGKSDRMTAEMYRSIMLNSDVIKHHHAFLRAAMSDCIEMLMVDSQTGGIKGRCVGMASQMVRVFRHIAKARKFIAIVLFVDLVAAFYSLLRQAGIPLKGTEKYINQVLDNALALAHPLLEVVLAAPVLVDPRVDQHLVAQVIEAHRLTHFRVPGDTQWIVSQRSSRAGNPLADFFFNAVYARPLRGIRFDMQQAGIAMDLKDCIDASEQVFSQGLTVESDAFTDSTFVDDSGFCSPCYDPTAVRDQVSLLGRIVRKHMLGSGFQLHFGKGKTAAVISYNGEGSLHAKRTMAKFSAIALDSTSNDRIVLEQAYKHVGGIYHGDESTGQEVARRKNKHSTALRPLRASVIKPEIAMKDKLKYIDALCSTHLFFQAETWDKISASCTTKLNHALLSGYRVGTRKLHSLLTVGRIADSEVLVIANRMEFCDVLRFRRLRSVARLVHSGSSTLRLLLDATLGVAGVLVHQVSVAHRAASIWQLESVKALAALPEASSVTFDVADFGGLRSSFGQALAVHCPHLSAAMLQRGLVARPAAALEDNNWVLPRPFLVLLGEAFLEAQPALCGGGALQWPTDPFLEAMLLPPERYPEVPSDEDQAWANPFDFLVTRRIRVVADAAAASDFAESMRQVAARAGGAAAAAVALDAEWRPDGAGAAQSAPALLQVACQEGPVQVWLLDLKWLCCRETAEECRAALRSEVDAALGGVLRSDGVRVLGFAFQGDLDRLASLPGMDCFLQVRRAVDLADACAAAEGSGEASRLGAGLAARLRSWTGYALDKSEQCSDWERRPLCASQVAYAAADAACLFQLEEAIAAHAPGALAEREMAPSRGSGDRGGGVAGRAAASRAETDGEGPEEWSAALGVVQSAVSAACSSRQGSCRLVRSEEAAAVADSSDLNALCLVLLPQRPRNSAPKGAAAVEEDDEALLVLTPAAAPLDIKWLGNWLGVSRRRLRMASPREVAERFGTRPGLVPPVPLRPGVRVLALPGLRGAAGGLQASAGHPGWRLLLQEPGAALPALAGAAAGAFEWLPSPASCLGSLDDVVCQRALRSARWPVGGGREGRLEPFRATVEHSLAALARKLRMVGIDCEVAGELLRTGATGLQGLQRVKIDVSLQDTAFRRAAALGRLIVTQVARTAEAFPGVHYLLHAKDADAQFSELLEVFSLQEALSSGGSRCGICNSNNWSTLRPGDVEGHVPPAVLEAESDFYQCGQCGQIFWEGAKYNNTMDSLKAAAAAPGAPARSGARRGGPSEAGAPSRHPRRNWPCRGSGGKRRGAPRPWRGDGCERAPGSP
ncbi:unnamed protein product, partial [Prorocentrum cordatum]